MKSALPFFVLGAAFLAGMAALIVQGPLPVSETTSISSAYLIVVAIVCIPLAALYFASFGVTCTFLAPRGSTPARRRTLDIAVALLSFPLAVASFLNIAPSIGVVSVALLTLPCVLGFSIGTIYILIRRLALP